MPLENLLTLIEKLRGRIDAHGDALRQSEALTRYTLIDPLLRELGWDTEDPDVVVPEYRLPNNQIADYVLYHDGNPAIVIESKKLAESLQGGKALDQGILYCAHTGANYFILTDGNSWELYEAGKTAPITSFGLTGGSVADVCLKALALWRPSVISGQIAGGATPVIGLPDDQPSTTEPQRAEETIVRSTSPIQGDDQPGTTEPRPTEETAVQPISLDLDEDGWQALSEYNPEPKTQPPSEITFPDGSQAPLKFWYEMLKEVVLWLMENGDLSEGECPIPRGPHSKMSLVNIEPVNSDGKRFPNPKPVGSLYFDAHGNLRTIITRTKFLIQHVGKDPAQFKVRLP